MERITTGSQTYTGDRKLPISSAVESALKKASTERTSSLKRKQSDEGKKKRISQKTARREDQEERRRWTKRQTRTHTYGSDEDDDNGMEEVDSDVVLAARQVVSGNGNSIVSGRKCKCGSTTHQRTSHRSCPHNKRNQKADKVVDDGGEGMVDGDDDDGAALVSEVERSSKL